MTLFPFNNDSEPQLTCQDPETEAAAWSLAIIILFSSPHASLVQTGQNTLQEKGMGYAPNYSLPIKKYSAQCSFSITFV